MKTLPSVKPTRQQLPIVLNDKPGVVVLRGAAGSGKTTTALLRLKQLCRARLARRARLASPEPVKVLVLTFNRSLAGYVSALAAEQVDSDPDLHLTVSTFASWAQETTGSYNVLSDKTRLAILRRLSSQLPLTSKFVSDEVSYAYGRFDSTNIAEYLVSDRDGRGVLPRVDKARMLNEVLLPYLEHKTKHRMYDWNDLAEETTRARNREYEIIIVDEAQDFTAGQVRAVLAHKADDASVTFVMDSVQRIYSSFFTWRETGLDANKFALNTSLSDNMRNTRQIAEFARPFVSSLTVDANGQLPDFNSATRRGSLPRVFGGSFSEQAKVIVSTIQAIDLEHETVGILHPLGGGWFNTLREHLQTRGLEYVELSQKRAWPKGPINIGLSTLHSAKGLEFDHVIICGVTGQTAPAPESEDQDETQNFRRLLAMAFGRARTSLLLCHDPRDVAPVLTYLAPGTYTEHGSTIA